MAFACALRAQEVNDLGARNKVELSQRHDPGLVERELEREVVPSPRPISFCARMAVAGYHRSLLEWWQSRFYDVSDLVCLSALKPKATLSALA